MNDKVANPLNPLSINPQVVVAFAFGTIVLGLVLLPRSIALALEYSSLAQVMLATIAIAGFLAIARSIALGRSLWSIQTSPTISAIPRLITHAFGGACAINAALCIQFILTTYQPA